MSILGYMTATEARAEGFTHHGSYYGIPLWIGQVDGEAPLVATKHIAMEPVMSLFHILEGLVRAVCWPDEEPGFLFKVGKEIAP